MEAADKLAAQCGVSRTVAARVIDAVQLALIAGDYKNLIDRIGALERLAPRVGALEEDVALLRARRGASASSK